MTGKSILEEAQSTLNTERFCRYCGERCDVDISYTDGFSSFTGEPIWYAHVFCYNSTMFFNKHDGYFIRQSDANSNDWEEL